MSTPEATLCYGNAGWYVEWFQEDDSPSGYSIARWYGSREACVARMSEPAPDLGPPDEERCTDAATASGMYDP